MLTILLPLLPLLLLCPPPNRPRFEGVRDRETREDDILAEHDDPCCHDEADAGGDEDDADGDGDEEGPEWIHELWRVWVWVWFFFASGWEGGGDVLDSWCVRWRFLL